MRLSNIHFCCILAYYMGCMSLNKINGVWRTYLNIQIYWSPTLIWTFACECKNRGAFKNLYISNTNIYPDICVKFLYEYICVIFLIWIYLCNFFIQIYVGIRLCQNFHECHTLLEHIGHVFMPQETCKMSHEEPCLKTLNIRFRSSQSAFVLGRLDQVNAMLKHLGEHLSHLF